MSYSVTPFEVVSRGIAEPVKCRFVHLYSAIATRHSDTIDCIFLMNGHRVTVAISGAALAELRECEDKFLGDQQLAEIAALHLRRTLEAGYDPAEVELRVERALLHELARELRYL